MAGNSATLTFAGDADSLRRAAKESTAALDDISAAASESARGMSEATKESTDFSSKMGHLGSAVSGATDALDSISGSLTAVNDLQQAGANRAAALRRALIAVESAQQDFNEALRAGERAQLDINRAAIDSEAAQLDAEEALTAYNEAVKEHGASSIEARRAANELKSAQASVAEAAADAAEAAEDLKRSNIDAKTAQEDLNDAMKEAHPPELQKWAENLQLITPLITAAVGVIGLITAAQWLWNASLWASPVTWIVIAVAAVVAGVILLATHTEELGHVWDVVWGGITDAALWAWDMIKAGAGAVWDYLKDVWNGLLALPGQLKSAFVAVTSAITAPFRAAFNAVSDAWNNTVGRLSWTVPGWVPGVGGNSISAPKLPKYHQGGIVSGALGAETLAILQAGERVSPAGGSGSYDNLKVTVELVGDGVLRVVRAEVGRRGGDVQRALGGDRG